MEYEVDLEQIEIFWSRPEMGSRRRLARITFSFSHPEEALPDHGITIVLDAHLKPDAELVDRAWAKLHDRLGEMQQSAGKAADRSRSTAPRDLRGA